MTGLANMTKANHDPSDAEKQVPHDRR